jgi:hypothetical protein
MTHVEAVSPPYYLGPPLAVATLLMVGAGAPLNK